jgi:hypothetical protein
LAFEPSKDSILNGDPETVLRGLLTNYGVSRYGVTLQMGPQAAKFFSDLHTKKGKEIMKETLQKINEGWIEGAQQMIEESIKNIENHVRFWRVNLGATEGPLVDRYFSKLK